MHVSDRAGIPPCTRSDRSSPLVTPPSHLLVGPVNVDTRPAMPISLDDCPYQTTDGKITNMENITDHAERAIGTGRK